MSNSSRNVSCVVFSNIAGVVTPALLTTMCSAPSASAGRLRGRRIGGVAVATRRARADSALPPAVRNAFGHSGGGVLVDVGDEHGRARVGERRGDGGADAATAPRR